MSAVPRASSKPSSPRHHPRAGPPEPASPGILRAPAEDAERVEDGAFEVEVASTGGTAVPALRPGKPSSTCCPANGFGDIPVSCEQGVCGTCVTRVLKGTPDHRDMFMTDQEHARKRSIHAMLLAIENRPPGPGPIGEAVRSISRSRRRRAYLTDLH